ncbi:MAG: DUF72 domain-containing protein [Devosia sp.]
MAFHPRRVGTAGWAVPKANVEDVAAGQSGLARYATGFDCAEINSTFKKQHRESTYARWADTVPDTFRFAVKFPKVITHQRRLVGCRFEVDQWLRSIAPLGSKLGPLLVQLPPSLKFDATIASEFFGGLIGSTAAQIICEPRHATWFTSDVDEWLASIKVGRVAADPPIVPVAARAGGYLDFTYIRLHGSPRVYFSAYSEADISRFAQQAQGAPGEAWCIFDNTAASAAFGDALKLKGKLERPVHTGQ